MSQKQRWRTRFPVLFNLILEGAIRKIPIVSKIKLFLKSTQVSASTDDINILSRFLFDAEESFVKLDDGTNNIGLYVNERKAKVQLDETALSKRQKGFVLIRKYTM